MDLAQKITAVAVLGFSFGVIQYYGGFKQVAEESGIHFSLPKDTIYVAAKEQAPSCGCSIDQVQELAYQDILRFTSSESVGSSEFARNMQEWGEPRMIDNCTWQVTYRISYPNGNTVVGDHHDTYITKRIGCDGRKVYVQ